MLPHEARGCRASMATGLPAWVAMRCAHSRACLPSTGFLTPECETLYWESPERCLTLKPTPYRTVKPGQLSCSWTGDQGSTPAKAGLAPGWPCRNPPSRPLPWKCRRCIQVASRWEIPAHLQGSALLSVSWWPSEPPLPSHTTHGWCELS